jgi:hypothetical protein
MGEGNASEELRRTSKKREVARKTMPNRLFTVEDYEAFIGSEVVDRILGKAKAFQGFRTVNFNSTFYGGGVAELLSGMTLLMNSGNTLLGSSENMTP